MSSKSEKKQVVVIGNGMVGHRFIEKLVEYDSEGQYEITTFCEEPRAAYDRVGLTSFFAHRDAHQLMIARLDWYEEQNIQLHIGDRATAIDRERRTVTSDAGRTSSYDYVVLATGSYPFVPPVPGVQNPGVFVYRTIEDLEKIINYGKKVKRCAVIGGGLLGLEAAKAAYDLGLETHVVEFAPRLMPRQVDDAGSAVLVSKIEDLGVQVHLNKATSEITGDGCVTGMVFKDGSKLDVDMIIVSAGIRPRDELAREAGIEVGERGGVLINSQLQTSDPDIYAIGEVACHGGMVYGLVAPGYEMADIVAKRLTGTVQEFAGADMSTKLKLMGVDVASFGDNAPSADDSRSLVFDDPFDGVYKKLFFTPGGEQLIGGILVGDASEYATLSSLARTGDPLPCSPGELISAGGDGAAALPMSDDTQVCSCNGVTRGDIAKAIAEEGLTSAAEVKSCTKAGSGCGGCMPLVTSIFKEEMEKAGVAVNNHLCEHFLYTRQELFDIVRIQELHTFAEVLESHGSGSGCEICKPAVASILASLWNENIQSNGHLVLQDTNDRFLANMQRGGLYSVVPRVPGGEITPDKLIVLGQVAKKYGLYTKITGGQRVDLFGAQLHQLPEIWGELVAAGFESGHAYGKSVRTVKSCVGTTWCRYGVQDSVKFAIRVEERYRGIRSPHKLKFAVSGCTRECAEAQSKDVGLIAVEDGYNLYVCGNGGTRPRHADLLASAIDEETAIKYVDRFLMYYIYTADKLTRTSVWLEGIEGGLEHLKGVVIDDRLGLCEEFEQRMQHLVDTYRCEWKDAVEDPEKRKLFRQFVNTDETEPSIEFVDERGQRRPADWPRDGEPLYQIGSGDVAANGASRNGASHNAEANGNGATNGQANGRPPKPGPEWVRVGTVADFPLHGGAAVKHGESQIAVFNLGESWYATQNMCPHKNAFVLSRGICGDQAGEPKISCPLHKKPFSLKTGECLSGEEYALKVFPVKVEGDEVFVELPPATQLDALLATRLHQINSSCTTACTV